MEPKNSWPVCQEDETEFVNGLRNRDQQVFTRMYNAFSPPLYGAVISWVKDRELAENLLQDIFVRVWNNSSQYDSAKGRLFVWVWRISRNICIDYLRSRRCRISRLSVFSGNGVHQLSDPAHTAIMPDHIGLRKMVNRLRSDEREILELLYFKGYTQAEVAAIKSMPIGTVKTRSSRAIKNLRRYFSLDGLYINQRSAAAVPALVPAFV